MLGAGLILKIFTVDNMLEIADCDYVTLDVSDDENGGFSGCYGIKKGHATAVISVREGNVTAQKNGETIFSAQTSSGLAMIKEDIIKLTVDKAQPKSF